MEPLGGDLESQGETSMLDDFTCKSPQDAVRWLLEVAAPQKTSNDEIPPVLEFVGAFVTAECKQKQSVIAHLVKGFADLPACERVKIILAAMDSTKAVLALKSAVAQCSQGEHVQPDSKMPTSEMPDLKPVVTLINSGVVDTAMISNFVQSMPAEQRDSMIELVKGAAVEQGLSESAIATLTQVAEQPQDVAEMPTADPDLMAAKAVLAQKKMVLTNRIVNELPQTIFDARLVQAAKVAVLQTGIVKVSKSIIESITELDHQHEAGGTQQDERKELEEFLVNSFVPQKDSLDHVLVHRALMPGGYVDHLLTSLKVLLFAYQYAWLFIALPLLELLLSLISPHCAMPLWAWLLFDSVLWLLTAGCVFYMYLEYNRCYSDYQAIEEEKLAEGTDVQSSSRDKESGATSSDSELMFGLVERARLWKIGLAASFCMLALLTGWAAMLVVSIEIIISFFVKCHFVTVVVALCFDALRIATLVLVVQIVSTGYKEYAALPLKKSDLSSASNYGSFA